MSVQSGVLEWMGHVAKLKGEVAEEGIEIVRAIVKRREEWGRRGGLREAGCGEEQPGREQEMRVKMPLGTHALPRNRNGVRESLHTSRLTRSVVV